MRLSDGESFGDVPSGYHLTNELVNANCFASRARRSVRVTAHGRRRRLPGGAPNGTTVRWSSRHRRAGHAARLGEEWFHPDVWSMPRPTPFTSPRTGVSSMATSARPLARPSSSLISTRRRSAAPTRKRQTPNSEISSRSFAPSRRPVPPGAGASTFGIECLSAASSPRRAITGAGDRGRWWSRGTARSARSMAPRRASSVKGFSRNSAGPMANARLQVSQMTASVQLVQALGGGWNAAQLAAQ